jgi:aminoacyl tRNA synthase complex-interacting multifunctional protein 1
MRGILSQAMVMCAKLDGKLEILTPPAGAVPGDIVEFEGFPRLHASLHMSVLRRAGKPDAEMNPKKKIFETVQVCLTVHLPCHTHPLQPDLHTDSNRVATYRGVPFTIKVY